MRHFPNKQFLSWLVLITGLACSVGLSLHVMHTVQREAANQFAFSADQLTIKVRERLESYELILRGGAALLESSESVTRQEWKSFVNKLSANEIVPGVQGIGFALLVKPEQLAAHVATVRAEGFPDYDINPTGVRDLYAPVVYLEPFSDTNLRAFGYDMLSEPPRQSAMLHARDTGLPTLSSRVTLVQDIGKDAQPGVLMFVPVYRAGMSTETVSQRRAALSGWAYSPYRMTDFMSGITKDWETPEGKFVDLHIYDNNKETPDQLIFDSLQDKDHTSHTPFYTQRNVEFYGHNWLLNFDRMSSAPPIDYTPALLVLASGLAITGLLFGLLRSLGDTISNASYIAGRLTKTLREREADLLEAQRIGKTGSWKLDLASGSMDWSNPLKQLFGESPAGQAKSLAEQQNLFTAESWENVTTTMAQAMKDGQPYEQELEIIDTSGKHAWMRIHGEGICDVQGNVVGLHGTASDITEHKQNQLSIKALTQLYAALSECNLAIVQCANDNELFARLCKLVVEQGGMDLAWIGQVDANNRVVATHSYGNDNVLSYLDGINISVNADTPEGCGPAGTAIRENRPFWESQFQLRPTTSTWHERAKQYDLVSATSIPLRRNGQPIGALTFYSQKVELFSDDMRKLLEQMGSNISYALDRFDDAAKAYAYQATLVESEQRFRILVEQSIVGIFILQDGTLTYCNPRAAQILGYTGSDMMIGQPTLNFIAPKNHNDISKLILSLLSEEINRAEIMFTALRQNGTHVDLSADATLANYRGRPAIIGLLQDVTDAKVAEEQILRYVKQLENTFIQTVSLATTLSEMRDAYTAGHERRVADISVAIGRELGLDESQLEGLHIGACLHDVGKITVPFEILSKPTRLTPAEYSLIKQHPQAGYDVLKAVDFPWPVALIALQHHERIDGTGYPQGLKGDEIILEARIVAVADVVESMASHRPYRAAIGLDKALDEIERGSGTIYDASVAQACLHIFRDKGYVIPIV